MQQSDSRRHWSLRVQLARLLCLLYLGTVFSDVQLAYAQPVVREMLPSIDLRSLEIDRNGWLRQVIQEQVAEAQTPQAQIARGPNAQASTSANLSVLAQDIHQDASTSNPQALDTPTPIDPVQGEQVSTDHFLSGSTELSKWNWNSLNYGSLIRSPAGALLAMSPAVLLVQGVVQPKSFNVQHQMHYSQSENYRIYTQLREDPRFLAQLQNTDLILLNGLDFPALSLDEQQRLLATMRQVIQQPVTGVSRAQEEQQLGSGAGLGTHSNSIPASNLPFGGIVTSPTQVTSTATPDYTSQATALASRSLRNMPMLRVNQQLGNELVHGLQDYAKSNGSKLIGDLQFGATNSVAACSGTRYSSLRCTKPVVLESTCTITPEFSHTVSKPAPPLWNGSYRIDDNTLERSMTLAGGALSRVIRVNFDSLSSGTQVTKVQVRTNSYLSTLTATGYPKISKDWVDITRAWNGQSKSLSLWVDVRSKQRYSSVTIFVRVFFSYSVPPQIVKWHEYDCPLAELREQGFTYFAPAEFQQLTPEALGGAVGENQPIYTTECAEPPQPIVEGCVEVDGKSICGITNPYNPALQSNKFCKNLVTTWRYLSSVPDDCDDKLQQATQDSQGLITNVTGIVLQQQGKQQTQQGTQVRATQGGASSAANFGATTSPNSTTASQGSAVGASSAYASGAATNLTQPAGVTGNPHDAYRIESGNCELVSSDPVTRTGNPFSDARDPWSAGFLRHGTRKVSGADLTVTGTVGVTLTYRCSAPATNQTCIDTILSRIEPSSCPLQVRVREQQVTYPLSEDFTCVMGHNCPAYLQAAPQASWHRVQVRTDSNGGASSSVNGSNSTLNATSSTSMAHLHDIRITNSADSARESDGVPSTAELHRLAQRAIPTDIVSTNQQCEVLSYAREQGLVAYRCSTLASYTNQLVQKVAECDDYQCQPGDPGCNKRVANSQSMAQVISATSILNAIQEDASCDVRTGDCQLFAGEARTCRCSINGLVDCCNLPTNVNLNDYLQLTFALTQLTNASFQALGKEARFGNWKNLGDVVTQGFAKGYQALKKPLTSAFESAFGNGVASSAASTAGSVAGSATSTVAGSATNIGSEVAASASSGALEAMRQMIMQSLNDWITETFGEELAAKIFTVEAGKIALNSTLANVFAFANNVYLAYSVGKLILQIAYRCHEHEYATAGKKKLRSCTLVGIYCSQEVAGVCFQTKTTTCCFSNPLSRILQEQIRRQLGMSFGTPENPDCRPLTTSMLAKVNWNQVNLDEWVGIMLANDNFSTLSNRLVEQKVFLTRVDDTTHGELATKLDDSLDTRDAASRNSQRLEHLSSQLSLERFVEQAKLFLLSE